MNMNEILRVTAPGYICICDGVKYRVITTIRGCAGCVFNVPNSKCTHSEACYAHKRKDNTSVIFQRKK